MLLKCFRFVALLVMIATATSAWAQAPIPAPAPVAPVPVPPGNTIIIGDFPLPAPPITGTRPSPLVSTTTTTTTGSLWIATGLWANYVTTTVNEIWSDGTVTVQTSTSSPNGTVWWSIYLTQPRGGSLSSTTVVAGNLANTNNPPNNTTPPYTITTTTPAGPGYPAGSTIVTTTVWTPSLNGLSYIQTLQTTVVLDAQGNEVFTYGTP